ncbi:MAG: dihydrodipicolinate synthase family protein [Chloroflexi bacterium]|nr:dihydrodipicolinate synthase family protein [Chloroflexota bacterium]
MLAAPPVKASPCRCLNGKKLHEATGNGRCRQSARHCACGQHPHRLGGRAARHAQSIHAPAMAAVTPTFYGLDDESLASYFEAIAAAAPDVPLILYDIPALATNGVSPALLHTLAGRIPSLAGIKSSRPDAIQVRQLLDKAPENIVTLAGNEAIALGLLALGMDGLLSGLATAVPEPLVALTQAMQNQDIAEARRQQSIIRQILALAPAGKRIGWLKQILNERGVAVGPAAPPLGLCLRANSGRPSPLCWPNPEMKLLLFDIDGTLIRSNSAGRAAMTYAHGAGFWQRRPHWRLPHGWQNRSAHHHRFAAGRRF